MDKCPKNRHFDRTAKKTVQRIYANTFKSASNELDIELAAGINGSGLIKRSINYNHINASYAGKYHIVMLIVHDYVEKKKKLWAPIRKIRFDKVNLISIRLYFALRMETKCYIYRKKRSDWIDATVLRFLYFILTHRIINIKRVFSPTYNGNFD